jgi:hypothetical protein
MNISFGQIIHVDYTYVTTPGSGSSNHSNHERINQIRKEKLEPAADNIWGPGNYNMDTFVKDSSSNNGGSSRKHIMTVQILTGADILAKKFKEAIGCNTQTDHGMGVNYESNGKQPDYVFNVD